MVFLEGGGEPSRAPQTPPNPFTQGPQFHVVWSASAPCPLTDRIKCRLLFTISPYSLDKCLEIHSRQGKLAPLGHTNVAAPLLPGRAVAALNFGWLLGRLPGLPCRCRPTLIRVCWKQQLSPPLLRPLTGDNRSEVGDA